jgi:hypothetical protein
MQNNASPRLCGVDGWGDAGGIVLGEESAIAVDSVVLRLRVWIRRSRTGFVSVLH